MKKRPVSKSGFSNPRLLTSFAFCALGVAGLIVFASYSGATAHAQGTQQNQTAGRLTPQEAQTLADGIRPLINTSTEGLVEVKHPDGSVSVDLQGRFQNVTVAKKEANGTISQACVNDATSAAAFLGIDRQLLTSRPAAPAGSQDQPAPK